MHYLISACEERKLPNRSVNFLRNFDRVSKEISRPRFAISNLLSQQSHSWSVEHGPRAQRPCEMVAQASMKAHAAVQAVKCAPFVRRCNMSLPLPGVPAQRLAQLQSSSPCWISYNCQRRNLAMNASSNGSSASSSGLAIDLTGEAHNLEFLIDRTKI